ncbi:hypothetical protein GCM10027073_50520 [Streptomyces chlorus]
MVHRCGQAGGEGGAYGLIGGAAREPLRHQRGESRAVGLGERQRGRVDELAPYDAASLRTLS